MAEIRKIESPGVRPLDFTEANRREAERRANEPGWMEAWDTARELDAFGPVARRTILSNTTPPDPNFEATEELWAEVTEGIPGQFQDRLLDARSEGELRHLADNIRYELRIMDKLGKLGWKGIGARVLAGTLDETALAAILATEGAAAPYVLASKLTRLGRAVRSGILAGGTNAAIESGLWAMQDTKSPQDILWAAATGVALGGAIGGIRKGAAPVDIEEADEFARAAGRTADEIEQREILQAGLDLEAPPNWKRDIKDLEAEVGKLEDAQMSGLEKIQGLLKLRQGVSDKAEPEGIPRTADEAFDALKRQKAKEMDEILAESKLDDALSRYRAKQAGEPKGESALGLALREKMDKEIEQLQDALDKLDGDLSVKRNALKEKYQEGRDLMFLRSFVKARTTPDEVLAREFGDVEPTPPTRVGGEFGEDSAGAARQGSPPEQVIDTDDLPAEAHKTQGLIRQEREEVGTLKRLGQRLDAILDNTRFDVTGRLKNSEVGMVRWLGQKLGEDAAPDAGEVAEVSASLISVRSFDSHMAKFYRTAMPAYKAWAKQNGYKWHQAIESREAFFQRVSEAVRLGNTGDAFVDAAADAIRKTNQELLEKVKQAGVVGFDNVKPRDNYLTRLWKPSQFAKLNEEAGVGAANIRHLIKAALLRGSSGLDDELAERISATIFTRFLRKSVGLDSDFNRMFFGRDVNLLAKVMRDSGADDDTIGRVIGAMKARDGADAASASPRAKFRLGMDEDTSITLANGRELHIKELWENNAEILHTQYVRHMSGHLAMAQKGFRSEADFRRMLEAARSEGATDGEIRKLEFLHKMIMGRPLEADPGSTWAQTARMLRDWNFMRVMGQVGFAQLAEIGNITGQLGWRTALAHIPELRRMVRRTQNGEIDHKLLAEMEDLLGSFGNERLLHQPHLRFEDVGVEEFATQGIIKRIDSINQYAKRGLGDVSLMAPINIGLQRVAATGIAQKFLKWALNPGTVNMKRIKSLGLDDDMLDRVLDQIKRYHKAKDNWLTGRKLKTLNLKDWDDIAAREAFAYAVNRWAYRIIQKNLPGETPMWMHSTLGKILSQFRTFMLTAYGKQLVHNVKMNDWAAYSAFMYSMLFGGLAYVTQTGINAIGRDDRDEWLKERLSAKSIGLSAFQRAGFASIIPGMADTALTWTPFMDEPLFAYGRTTGLASDILLGNPTVDLLNKIPGAFKGTLAAPLRDDYEWSQRNQRDLWGLLFFSNALGMRNLNELMLQDLPRQSTLR